MVNISEYLINKNTKEKENTDLNGIEYENFTGHTKALGKYNIKPFFDKLVKQSYSSIINILGFINPPSKNIIWSENHTLAFKDCYLHIYSKQYKVWSNYSKSYIYMNKEIFFLSKNWLWPTEKSWEKIETKYSLTGSSDIKKRDNILGCLDYIYNDLLQDPEFTACL